MSLNISTLKRVGICGLLVLVNIGFAALMMSTVPTIHEQGDCLVHFPSLLQAITLSYPLLAILLSFGIYSAVANTNCYHRYHHPHTTDFIITLLCGVALILVGVFLLMIPSYREQMGAIPWLCANRASGGTYYWIAINALNKALLLAIGIHTVTGVCLIASSLIVASRTRPTTPID